MGLNPADFLLATTGAVNGANIIAVNGMGSSHTVTVITGTGDGDHRLKPLQCYGHANPFITNIPFVGGIATY